MNNSIRKLKVRIVVTTVFVFLLSAASIIAGELEGVKLPDEISVGGQTIKLNGMGLRKKYFVKVYVAGLYLKTPTHDGSAATSADEPKSIVMVFLRDASSDDMKDAWIDGFVNTDPNQALKDSVAQFLGYFTLPCKTGEQIVFDYIPGTGVVTTLGGEKKPPIPGVDFMKALFGIWLGSDPPTKDVQDGMLGAM